MSGGARQPLIKICGVTRPEDARLAVELGADLLGLNFYPRSPRALDVDRDRRRLEEIAEAVRQSPPVSGSKRPGSAPSSILKPGSAPGPILKRPGSAPGPILKRPGSAPGPALKRPGSAPAGRERSEPPSLAPLPDGRTPLVVGVFVNEDPTRIEETAEAACLDLIQLHGDEDPEAVARFGGRAIKVFRRGSLPDPEELAEYEGVWGLLFDVPARPADDDAYGGTGRSWNYEMLAPLPRGRGARQVLVAGGIRPGNARRALERSRADGIDVCSGVESAPGVKDPERMRRLFEEVRHGTP